MYTKIFTLSAASLLFANLTSAGLVTAYEEIVDPAPFDFADRDLTRTRSSAGFFEVETDDSKIVSQNAVDAHFGLTNLETVNYKHDLSWLIPSVDRYIDATLTISAWGSLGNDDGVIIDNVSFLGVLPSGFGSGTFGFSTFTFYSNTGSVLDVILGDGELMVSVDKNIGARRWFLDPQGKGYNALSVYSSRLDVSYMAVPEPSTILVSLTGLFIAGLATRRRRSKS